MKNLEEFGRLPDDVLKYITLLGATPQIEFDNPYLKILSPYISYEIPLFVSGENNIEENEHIDTTINDIDLFIKNVKTTCKLFLYGYFDPEFN